MPAIILLHGGGLSDWSWQSVVKRLSFKYNIITPIIDGHGEDGDEEFISIEDSAHKLTMDKLFYNLLKKRRFAKLLHETIKGSALQVMPKMKHEELSLAFPHQYIEKLTQLFEA